MRNKFVINSLNYGRLNNVNCEVQEPSIIALIGKNNSELDIFFKCLSDIYNYSGTVLLDDENIKDCKKVSFCIPITNLSEKNVFDNLIEPLLNIEFSNTIARKKVYDLAKRLDINKLLYKSLNELSYSQKKVISFAKSVISEPGIILLDHIFTSVDEYYKSKMLDYLLNLKNNNNSIIIYTTNSADELLFSDKIMILLDGSVVIFDDTKKVFKANEKIFSDNKLLVPFIVDLSYKLKAYNLINKVMYDSEKMVDELWN